MHVLAFLLIGLIAGRIASMLVRGGGLGLLGNMILGIVGAVIGGYIFDLLDIAAGGWTGRLATAVVGAVVLLGVVSLFRRGRI